jgi:hypothetical protein
MVDVNIDGDGRRTIQNRSADTALPLRGWSLRDPHKWSFRFPAATVLARGERLLAGAEGG